ncbi:hypothetical protein [Pseudomonas sp. DP16D-R1]|uniref:hypothetical protein n=1 Tax=Pseudomonas sp. DP16D-R1 TaxID=2075551 RepID=UPI000CD32268|nr:hypothetical protein [Pseudomonas sp. DP16D-R1]POA73345.1 hypothetical protein C1890_27850 [Pseudomonas sp. DP16D-R1]
MIDTVHNQRLVKAYELIDFIGTATDLESLVLLFGRAYGYIESLRDAKILPNGAFANLEEQARMNFDKINTQLGVNARRPEPVAPTWKATR